MNRVGIPTTLTTLDILMGRDCPTRQARVAKICESYQPMLQDAAGMTLKKYCYHGVPQATLEDMVGDEILLMLDPEKGYFRKYDRRKGRLRKWIKWQMRNRIIDHLRRESKLKELDEREQELKQYVDSTIDVLEYQAIFKKALQITKEHFQHIGEPHKYGIFYTLKTGERDPKLIGGMSEWDMRKTRKEVHRYIEEPAIAIACSAVSSTPDESREIAVEIWEKVRKAKLVELDI